MTQINWPAPGPFCLDKIGRGWTFLTLKYILKFHSLKISFSYSEKSNLAQLFPPF